MFWSESGEKAAQIKHRLQDKTALNKYVTGFWCERQQEMDWRKRYYGLWTHILVKNFLMMDLFQLLSSQDVNWWTGVVWIIVMFLSAVWTLILTAPIHCRASIDETLMQCYISPNMMKNTFILILDGLRISTFSANFHVFVWTIPCINKVCV